MVVILTEADYAVLNRMSRGTLSGNEARAFLEKVLCDTADWGEYHQCLQAAVEGGYSDVARAAIQKGGRRGLEQLLDVLLEAAAKRKANPS